MEKTMIEKLKKIVLRFIKWTFVITIFAKSVVMMDEYITCSLTSGVPKAGVEVCNFISSNLGSAIYFSASFLVIIFTLSLLILLMIRLQTGGLLGISKKEIEKEKRRMEKVKKAVKDGELPEWCIF